MPVAQGQRPRSQRRRAMDHSTRYPDSPEFDVPIEQARLASASRPTATPITPAFSPSSDGAGINPATSRRICRRLMVPVFILSLARVDRYSFRFSVVPCGACGDPGNDLMFQVLTRLLDHFCRPPIRRGPEACLYRHLPSCRRCLRRKPAKWVDPIV